MKKIPKSVSQNKKEKNAKIILTFQPFKSNSKRLTCREDKRRAFEKKK